MAKQSSLDKKILVAVTSTQGMCAIGEKVGERSIKAKSIPVLSCEGACIRGEIARLAANLIAQQPNYQRGCHGELFTIPNSKIARWIKDADKVICIDGCFLKCHSRVLENIIDPRKLFVFDALAHHEKYCDKFNIDEVSEAERKEVAKNVAQWVLKCLKN